VTRTINTLWAQGLAAAPPVVQLCIERWRTLNPGWELRVFDEAVARAQLAGCPIDLDQLSPQAFSDVLRCTLLQDGGVWVDATTLPIAPLDAWLERLQQPAGFFAFEWAADRPIASWLLAATPRHRLLELWWEAVLAYWDRPRTLARIPGRDVFIPSDPVAAVSPPGSDGTSYPYFWFHYLFRRLVETEPEAADIWQQVPRVSSLPPHGVQLLFSADRPPSDAELAAAMRGTVVQKLDWRAEYPLDRLERLLPAP
jgi:hypothetical protein